MFSLVELYSDQESHLFTFLFCFVFRHKTNVSTLKEIVPQDLVTYCQEHGLLDSVLGDSESEANPPKVLGLTSVGSNKGQYFRSIE